MKEFYRMSIDNVIKKLETNKEGLSSSLISERALRFGKNVIPKKRGLTIFEIFFQQFINPIIIILLIAAFLSLAIGERLDAWFILGIVISDALLGTIQEWRASKKAQSLQNLIKATAKVIRDGKEMIIPSEELVVGDVVLIESGVKVPADLRLFESNNLTIDEAILTGESIPESKNCEIIETKKSIGDQTNMAFVGTSVFSGRGRGIVVAVGLNSEIGQIIDSVLLSKSEKTPLVIRMEKFTKQIAFLTIIVGLFLLFLLYFKGEAFQEIFFLIVALTISAIPEGLPVVLTFALSIASTRMAKRNVLVKKLNAVESLGSCTVIATDKTGTLTNNQQTASIILVPDERQFMIEGIGYNGNGKVEINQQTVMIAEMGALNNEGNLFLKDDKWHYFGDSIDVAFLSLALKAKVKVDKKRITSSIPYESEQKFSAVFFDEKQCTIKGSFEKVISFCNKMRIDGGDKPINLELLEKQNLLLAGMGYRVIALASGGSYGELASDIKDLTFLGMVAFIDPIREEVITAIEKCRQAGIKVVMITGDHPLTAFAIAKQLKMADNISEVTDGEEIDKKLKGKGFDRFVFSKKVFSRVSPLQKLEIVKAYKRGGEFVAVTGDGVNDAPALKVANIGVAVGSGTDVAKETSQMIIIDDNFMSLVAGVEEGRVAYSNIRKVIAMLLSTGVAEVLMFVMAIIFNLPLPLIALQLLWLNIVTSGIQDVALAFEKAEKGVMEQKPRRPDEKIFDLKMIEQIFLAAVVMAIITFYFWTELLANNVPLAEARSYVILLMVFMQNVHVINCRSEKHSLFKMKFRNNPFVFGSIFITLGIHFLVTQTSLSRILSVEPIPFSHIVYVFILALPIVLVMELYKWVRLKKS